MQALVFGATDTIATMRWPDDTAVTIVDWSTSMARRIRSNAALPKNALMVRADWRELPIGTGSVDIAIGDGSSGVLPSRDDAVLYFNELHRALRPGGTYCERSFCRPDRRKDVDELFHDLASGRLPNLDCFRLVLAMTIQGDSPDGVSLKQVWAVWNERIPDPHALRERRGWTEHAIRNFESWRDNDGRYSYYSRHYFLQLVEPWFDVIECDEPSYPSGDYFPRILMRRR
jgi:SAM-dependent methyltransferase